MAALEEFEGLDLSSYKCIYISFGSKNGEEKLPFYHDFPFFLEMINKYPLCVISIDNYPEFTSVEKVVPFNEFVTEPPNRYTHITIPSRTMDKTIGITKKLVELLDKNESAQVFFVNFIKYKSKTAHDAVAEQEAIQIESHLGKYIDNYYHWYGFGLFKDFIIKNIPFFDRVKMILYFKDNPDGGVFLEHLKNDVALRRHQPKTHAMLRYHLIDITPTITSEQIALLDPDFTEFSGGTRKRRRRRKTKRRKNY